MIKSDIIHVIYTHTDERNTIRDTLTIQNCVHLSTEMGNWTCKINNLTLVLMSKHVAGLPCVLKELYYN